MAKEYLCIDVGGTFIKYGVINEQREINDSGKVATPYESAEVYLDTLADIYHKFEGRVEGIAMSVPGMIDSKNGVCVTSGALKYATGLHLVEELEKRCNTKIAIMNDAKCAALAEASWGSLADVKDGVVIAIGTGIGGALIKDGKVHMGAHFGAGEFSFIAMSDDLDLGQNLWAQKNNHIRLAKLAAKAKGLDPENVSGEDVFRWVREGDVDAIKALDHFTLTLARMIMNLQMIYDPDRFAIGGGISAAPEFLMSIQKNLDYLYRIYPMPCPHAEVVNCQFRNDANLLGAYANYLDMCEA